MVTIDRRLFLASLGAVALPAAGKRQTAEVTVLVDEPIGRISPLIYGQFAEHIGRLIYGGVWVGKDSATPNRGGYRLDTLEALARVQPAVVRWPGGCFADAYHWEDGVGPVAERKKRHNHWWLREEPNTFGSGEFLGWCEALKAEPYLSVNVGTGTVSEALNWLEYVNGEGDSHYAALRARHGREKPYGVQWWGIGNENWGCGGLMTPEEYAQQFRQYAVYFKRLGLTTDLQLVGVGHTADDWNRKFLAATGPGLPYLDHLSVHRYFRRGHSTEFTDAEHVELMLDVAELEKTINDALDAIDQFEPIRAKIPVFGSLKPKPIGLVIDEWGVWHSDAKLEDGFRQSGVMREALFAASCLNVFHQHAARVTMANIAQVMDCLHALVLTDEESIVLTPTFHVYEMYAPHRGADALRTEVAAAPTISGGQRSQPALSLSASQSGSSVFVTLVNQDAGQAMDAVVAFRGGGPKAVTARALVPESVRAQNTRENPDAVAPREWAAQIDGSKIQLQVPAGSVVAIDVRMK